MLFLPEQRGDRNAVFLAKEEITINIQFADIGLSDSVGEQFDILVVLPNASARKIFNKYLEDSAKAQNWPGLTTLPEGVTLYDRVMVTRK